MNVNRVDNQELNQALDSLMQTGNTDMDQPAGAGETISSPRPDMTESENNGGMGRLVIQATTANRTLPVQGAKVTIMNSDETVVDTRFTDNSGRTEAISLKAPEFRYSQEPSTVRPYSVYNVRVEKEGFYTQEFLNVVIFDRIESIQPVVLEPLGEDALEKDRIIVIDENGSEQAQ